MTADAISPPTPLPAAHNEPVSEPLTFTLNEAMVQAVARLVDDAGAPREPSHSDLEAVMLRAGLLHADPHRDPTVRVGKQKRVRQMLSWAMDNDEGTGAAAVGGLISMIRGCGGFRPGSPNYCGRDAIETCVDAFATEPVELTLDGQLRPRSLAGLSGRDLTVALRSYVVRAQKGFGDSVLIAGTNKDLIEATAAHVLVERFGANGGHGDFPTLLGQAFAALGLNAKRPTPDLGGLPGARVAMEVALYELGCSVNRLRNKGGSGHGRPFLPELSAPEVRAATEAAGLVAGRMLDALGDA
jgi:Abortive infection C-terminus